ncbi:MAG: hypothetical protein HY270_14345 [Deltaproteobacteria bacterium]|nr:hypothetical protein [Deltaproteobacteria bacterium]
MVDCQVFGHLDAPGKRATQECWPSTAKSLQKTCRTTVAVAATKLHNPIFAERSLCEISLVLERVWRSSDRSNRARDLVARSSPMSASKNIAIERRRQFIAALFMSPLLLVLVFHVCSPTAVFPSDNPDAGFHLAVTNRILDQGFWPPPYSGMIGSHTFAAVLHSCLGLPVPRAMLVVADINVLLLMAAVLLTAQSVSAASLPFAAVAVLVATLPISASMFASGFYGHAVSFGPYALAMYFLLGSFGRTSEKETLLAAIVIACAAVFYPDQAIWLLPSATFPGLRHLRRPGRLIVFLSGLMISAGLWATQAELLGYVGAIQRDWRPQLGLVVVLALAAVAAIRSPTLQGRAKDAAPAILGTFASYLVVLVLTCAVGFIRFGSINYYAQKDLYALGLFIPWLTILVASTPIGRVVAVVALATFAVVSFEPGTWINMPETYERWSQARASFDVSDDECAKAIEQAASAAQCRNPAAIPGSQIVGGDHPWERTQRLIAYNSYVGNFDTDEQSLRLTRQRDVHAIADLLNRSPSMSLEELVRQVPGLERYDCLALASSIDADEATPLFACPQVADRNALTLYRTRSTR